MSRPSDLSPRAVLEAVGIGAAEEGVYEALLEQPGSTLAEMATVMTPMSHRRLSTLLASLESKGLVSHSPSKVPRFSPTSPDGAVEVLILRKQEDLERARLAAARLLEKFRRGKERTSSLELVEVVSGREALIQLYLQMQRSATREWLALDKPPYVTPDKECTESLDGSLSRSVKCRTIYAREALERPGRLKALRRTVALGEEARTLSDVPMKVAISDRRLALIPLRLDEPNIAALMVYPSPLLEAVITMVDALWERAVPIRFAGAEVRTMDGQLKELSDDDRMLLAFMAAGLKDEGIARQLGVGLRTVERRIKRIMNHLGAETRFQAGLQAALQGRGGTHAGGNSLQSRITGSVPGRAP